MIDHYLSEDTLATVLLCGGLGGDAGSPSPLTLREWNGLVRSLIRANWRPGDLVHAGSAATAAALELAAPFTERIETLLGQGVTVATALEKLATQGITVLSRADEAYPSRLRTRLKDQSPPLLFCAGPITLFERAGVAAVGSRDVDPTGTEFAAQVGLYAAQAGVVLISGGARGVDRVAMAGALEAGGEAIGILPDGLAKLLRSPEIRNWVAEGQLLLTSPFRPNSRFEVWKAMERNKLIYGLAEFAFVVSSDADKGGTWTGATENLKRDWAPLLVRDGENVPGGNRRLIDLGGIPVTAPTLAELREPDLLAGLQRLVQNQAAAHSYLQPALPGESEPGSRPRRLETTTAKDPGKMSAARPGTGEQLTFRFD
ncbi:MAG: DNA-processing protein DprA [Chloroflexota bacterium]|nr:DNA-processing protein DprA [Chloroflexota bacterium]